MDISRFVNSRDIREHLQTINYEFNAMEAAWLVYQCANATIEERHTAWAWIIENMADMEGIERPNCIYRKSLHDTLRRYMAMENEFLDANVKDFFLWYGKHFFPSTVSTFFSLW